MMMMISTTTVKMLMVIKMMVTNGDDDDDNDIEDEFSERYVVVVISVVVVVIVYSFPSISPLSIFGQTFRRIQRTQSRSSRHFLVQKLLPSFRFHGQNSQAVARLQNRVPLYISGM